MAIPIGLSHLLRHLPTFLAPFIFSYVLVEYGVRRVRPDLPAIVVLPLFFVLPSAYFFFSSVFASYSNRNAAARIGATLPPALESSFAGLSLARELDHSIKHGYIGDFLAEWSEKYGNTIGLTILSEYRIMTTEPQHVKAILATQFDDFEKGPLSGAIFNSFLGTGVFNSDGERWKFHRSMTRPFFSKDRISHFDIFDRHAEDALHQTAVRLAEGYPIDFQDMISRFTLDSATEFLFGQDVRSLSAGLEYPPSAHVSASNINHPANIFAHAFLEGLNFTAYRTSGGNHWPLFEWNDKVKPFRVTVNKFVDPIVANAIERYKALPSGERNKEEKEAQEGETLLDHLVKTTQDHQILSDEILNIMIAGRDTTACTLTYAVYMLAENPHVIEKLRAEILEKVGPTRRPDFDDLRDMKYLRAFINETLRLYPAVPFDARASKRATTLPPSVPGGKPYYVPANTTCVYSVFLMHRRTDLWGPSALAFDPDRFLDDRVKLITKNPYIFLPFNGGPRICLGQQFAYHEVSFFLIKLLQKFSSFSLAPDAQPVHTIPPKEWAMFPGTKGREKVTPGAHLTMFVKGGLWMRMGAAQ